MMMMIRPGAATAHRHVLVGGFCSPPPTSLRLRDRLTDFHQKKEPQRKPTIGIERHRREGKKNTEPRSTQNTKENEKRPWNDSGHLLTSWVLGPLKTSPSTAKIPPKHPQTAPTYPPKAPPKIRQKPFIMVSLFFEGSKYFGLSHLVSLRFLEVLEGLERSGRLIGTISSYFHRNPTSWFRLLTKRLKKLRIKKATTISMWAQENLQQLWGSEQTRR